MTNSIKLRRIDLKKSTDGNHPDIIPNKKTYLCKIKNQWYAGKFSKQWYGLNFQAVYDAGLQYHPPGTNASQWQEIYEIVKR